MNDHLFQIFRIMEVTGSKDKVKCSSCGQEMRKDTIERHWKAHHPTQKLEVGQSKWKPQSVRGQSSLLTLGFKAVPPVEKVPAAGGDVDMVDAEEEVGVDSPDKRLFDEVDENENFPSKRVKGTDQTTVEEKVDNIAKDVKEIKEMMINRTDLMKEPQTAKAALDENDTIEIVLKTCRTKEQFNDKIKQFKIIKEEDVKPNHTGYFCEICFDGVKPRFDVQQSGVFLLDDSKDDTTENKLSAALKNLKKHVKSHLDSKVHKQKIEILEARNKRDEDRNSRLKTIGLNVFRTRYNAIKQARSRSDFEQDILKGRMKGEDLGNINHSNSPTDYSIVVMQKIIQL